MRCTTNTKSTYVSSEREVVFGTRMAKVIYLIVVYTTLLQASSSAECWSTSCISGEEFCVERCNEDSAQCTATINVDHLGTVEPVLFQCINRPDQCQEEQCVLASTHVEQYSCCCSGLMCNSVYGITPTGGSPPAPVFPTSFPPGTPPTLPPQHEICEFYNCSEDSTESCYHGYVTCADDPLAHPNHTHHYCEAIYHRDDESELYKLYRKGCLFTATECTSDCHVEVIKDDTDIACCCDGQLCNVNITFSDPSEIHGFLDPCDEAGCNSSCLVPTDGNPVCYCASGYALDEDQSNCVDIDECEVGFHDCVVPAMCVNTEGSFGCNCPIELRLTENGTNCETTGLQCESLECTPSGCTAPVIEYCDELSLDGDIGNVDYESDRSHQFCLAFYVLEEETLNLQSSQCVHGEPWADLCVESDRCILGRFSDLEEDANFYVCCCSTNFCNTKIVFPDQQNNSVTPSVSASPTATVSSDSTTGPSSEYVGATTIDGATGPSVTPLQESSSDDDLPQDITIFFIVIALAVLLVIGCVIVTLLCLVVHQTKKRGTYPPPHEMQPMQPSSSPVLGQNLHFKERIGQGRFASVWRSKMGSELSTEMVAVKVFSTYPRSHLESFEHELDIYLTPGLQHKNVLKYITNEKRDNELYLILMYHPNGSLYDLLRNQQITLNQFCKLAQGAAAGLAHLHSELIKDGRCIKPPIAHRDLKTKNVLVMSDWSACISDLGLAVKLDLGETPEAHGQVGTARYMAPEVLEGAIHFQREAFQRIDVYTLALVLWEMASRTQLPNGTVEEYRPPFQAWGASPNPSIDEMKNIVVMEQRRPEIPKGFMINSDLDEIVDTIQESWDQDAEARLSAQCIEERIRSFRHTKLGAAISKDSGFTDNHESLDSTPQTPSFSSGPAMSPLDGKASSGTTVRLPGNQEAANRNIEIDALNCSPRNQRYSMNNFPDNNASQPRHHEYRVYNNYGHSTETTV